MKLFSRVTIGLLSLSIVGCLPIMAGTIWDGGVFSNNGLLPGDAQTQIISGDTQSSVDGIIGNLSDVFSSAMFRIWIADPTTFTASANPDPTNDPNNPLTPQIFLFDNGGLPVVGAAGFFVGQATITTPFPLITAGYYYLMVDAVALDPINTSTDLTGSLPLVAPLFCLTDPVNNPIPLSPCPAVTGVSPDMATQPIGGYQGVGLNSGDFVIGLTGVTAQTPEPGTVFLFLSGAALVLAGKKRPSVAGSFIRVISRLRAGSV